MVFKESLVEAWEYNHACEQDQRLPHKHSPNRPVPLARLHELGVFTESVDVDDEAALQIMKNGGGYIHTECITLSPETTVNFDEKIRGFFKEHMHSQEEVRVILDGTGYWDIRDHDDKWIRFAVKKGDVIVLPAGMFHRFTVDEYNFIKALLLYTQVPHRTQHEKGTNEELTAARQEYVKRYLSKFTSSDKHNNA